MIVKLSSFIGTANLSALSGAVLVDEPHVGALSLWSPTVVPVVVGPTMF